jgi:diadenylate cyclase
MVFEIVRTEWLRMAVEIGLLAFVIYQLLMLIRGTRAMQVIIGLIFVGLFSLVADYFNLHVISSLLDKFWLTFFIAVVVLFQPEFRRVLAQIGQRGLLWGLISEKQSYLDEIVKAACTLSQKRVGALIVIEREGSLDKFAESGVRVGGEVNAKLIQTIFSPYTPLHDGALIIQNGVIMAAACLLPLTEKTEVEPELGTRHRAAIGLTEEYDAVVVVVSEETGIISVAEAGALVRNLDEETLTTALRKLLGFEKLDLDEEE